MFLNVYSFDIEAGLNSHSEKLQSMLIPKSAPSAVTGVVQMPDMLYVAINGIGVFRAEVAHPQSQLEIDSFNLIYGEEEINGVAFYSERMHSAAFQQALNWLLLAALALLIS